MAGKKADKVIIKPLAAAFLTKAPEENTEIKEAPAKAKPSKAGKTANERTKAMLKEQLLPGNEEEKEQTEKKEEKKAPAAVKKEAVKKETVKKEEKKAPVKKEPVKKETVKNEPVKKEAVKKAPVKKEPEKKEAARQETAKEQVSTEVIIEYAGRSYGKEELIEAAYTVWSKKLKRGRKDLKEMELYFKPEEQTVYYVFNQTRKGNFNI